MSHPAPGLLVQLTCRCPPRRSRRWPRPGPPAAAISSESPGAQSENQTGSLVLTEKRKDKLKRCKIDVKEQYVNLCRVQEEIFIDSIIHKIITDSVIRFDSYESNSKLMKTSNVLIYEAWWQLGVGWFSDLLTPIIWIIQFILRASKGNCHKAIWKIRS